MQSRKAGMACGFVLFHTLGSSLAGKGTTKNGPQVLFAKQINGLKTLLPFFNILFVRPAWLFRTPYSGKMHLWPAEIHLYFRSFHALAG